MNIVTYLFLLTLNISNYIPLYSSFTLNSNTARTTVTRTNMIRVKGLEEQEEGATPTSGGMTLYLKAGPDGKSVGDCPFAHYVRMVLHEKNLPYDLRPSTQETKPDWLIDFYGGSMPALRHRKECYVESDVIAQYLDFFFVDQPLSAYPKKLMNQARDCTEGFFPAVAKYLKCTTNGDEKDTELKGNLESALQKIEAYMVSNEEGVDRKGPYLVGDGEKVTLLDCALAPKLYHLDIGLKAFKDGAIDLKLQFPKLTAYMDAIFQRESFKETVYDEDIVIWGWTNARGG